jgi:hypothetical protein
VNRPFRFQKCCQDFFSSHNERLSVAGVGSAIQIDCASKMPGDQAQFFHDSAFVGTSLHRLFSRRFL